jgi:L-fuculose-phosphate aldolase
MIYIEERKAVARIMRRLYKQGLTTSSGGNVSMKDDEGNIFITASQTDKSCLKWKEIIVFDKAGKNLTPELKPSMESGMHIEIYKARSEIRAIVHSHPIYASTFAVSGFKPESSLTGEARYVLGKIAMTGYKLMGTENLAKEVASALNDSDCAIMKNHGAICIGKTLYEAFDRMEVLEFTCKLNFNTILLKNKCCLSESDLNEIDRLKKSMLTLDKI